MKTVTNGFKEEIAKLGREIDFRFFLHTNDKIITQDGKFLITQANQHLVVEQFDEEEIDETINAEDIYSVSIVNRGNLLSTMMKELDFEISKDLRIGDIIECEFGLKVEGNYEYINYGKYMIYEKDFNEDTKTFNYIAYDRMLLTMQEASQDFLEDLEGRTLANCINVICGKVGLSFNATQEELAEYPNLSKQINEGTFTDMQITYRDILDMICQALGLSMIVGEKTLVLKPAKDNNGKFVPYEIKGNTIQEGTPTPSNPIEIQNITGQVKHNGKTVDLGDIELCKIGNYQDKIRKSTGKNLLNLDNKIAHCNIYSSGNIAYDVSEGVNVYYAKVQPNETYTISQNNINRQFAYNFFVDKPVENATGTSRNLTTGTKATFTIPSGYNYVAIREYQPNEPINGVQLEKGSQATEYEPFGELWYLHKEIGKIIFTGNDDFVTFGRISGGSTEDYMQINATLTYNDISNVENGSLLYSNSFIYYAKSTSPTKEESGARIYLNNLIVFSIPTLVANTVDDWKTWLSNNNVTFYYVLTTPITEEITDTTLINQLNDAGILNIEINEQYLKDTNVSFSNKYMVNSVVLSRSEDNDNIYRRDEESIAENGVHEFKIKDNLIMLYDDREDYIDEIFEQLNGLEYYINDFSSTGITYLDWLDFYNVNIGNKTYKCLMLNDEINIEQGLEENIYTEEPEETVTDYKTSSKTDKEVSFIVDKQNGKINAKVSKGDIINEINLDETGAEINAEKISLAGKTIQMTSENISISSTNFNVDKNGNVTANNLKATNGEFSGKINASTGNISGWNIDNNGINNGTLFLHNDGSSTVYTVADLIIIRGYIMGLTGFSLSSDMIRHYDINNDGVVDALDYTILQNLIGINMSN